MIGAQDLEEWGLFYILKGSDADPDITEWDDKDSITRKLAAKAAAKG